jgi:beta-galactosidase/beta-glucuronidase
LAGRHEGGYTPFQFDVTELLLSDSEQTIIVRAEDDPQDLAKQRGKQDWQLHPHSIWYPRTTGIWQTVWLERVSNTWIDHVRWTPNVERWEISLDTRLQGDLNRDLRLKVLLRVENALMADDTYAVISGEVHRRIVSPTRE